MQVNKCNQHKINKKWLENAKAYLIKFQFANNKWLIKAFDRFFNIPETKQQGQFQAILSK